MRVTVGQKVLWDPVKLRPRDWLLIVGLTLAPMTSLRIWKIGPGEVLCLLWGIKYLFTKRIRNDDISFFFILFIITLGLGSLVGSVVAPDELRIYDLLTWVYLGVIAISVSNGLRNNSKEYNERLLFLFSVVAVLWYLFLYLYSRYVNISIWGVPLWYSGRRFSGGATNPHQIAVLLCALCFIFLRKILSRENMLISIAGIAGSIFLIMGTDSSTAVLAVALGMMISAYFFVSDHFPKQRKKVMLILSLVILLTAVIGFRYFYGLFIRWVSNDKNGLGRFDIFASFPSTFLKSPIVGLGPGVHGRGGSIEFHNSYLEVLAASGLIGGIVFLIFSIRVFKKTIIADWKLLIIVVSMYAYGLAGFAMRKLAFWGVISFVITIADQINNYNQPQHFEQI